MSSPFETNYSVSLIRFWRVPWHRQALQVLAEAVSPSDEADRLGYEWELIQAGHRAEFQLRREWATTEHGEFDLYGWQDTPRWGQIVRLYGPPRNRHRCCLCSWLYSRGYPVSMVVHGGAGDAGGRARRLVADLDSGVAALPISMQRERDIELGIARHLGWLPRELLQPDVDGTPLASHNGNP